MTDNLKDNYSLYSGSLGFGERLALILVDFVQASFDKDCDMYAGVEDELASALRIREVAREAGIKVLYSYVVCQQDGCDGGVFFNKAPVLKNFITGNPMGNWPKGLQSAANEMVISKQCPARFRHDVGVGVDRRGHRQAINYRPDDEWLRESYLC